MKRLLILTLLALVAALPVQGAEQEPVTRIAFGSCSHQDDPQPIWHAINADRPEVFVFLGDNIYGDSRERKVLQQKYLQLAEKPGFKTLREKSQVIATWDDHDYGENDAGAEYPSKQASREVMLDFWGEPKTSERRTQEGGIYTSYVYGPPGKRVQVLLLDLRWNRSPLKSVSRAEYQEQKEPRNMGPYEPIDSSQAVLLGEPQWLWLEEQLQEPADLRLIGSSIQLLPEFTGWESWANFPMERQRLFDLINHHKVSGVYIISGDTHWSEFSRVDDVAPYSLWETTSSGLTEEWKAISPNRHRLGDATHSHNYGLIEIDWDNAKPEMTVSIKGETGNIYLQNTLRLSELIYSRP